MLFVVFVVTGVGGLGLVGWWAADWWRDGRWYRRQAEQVGAALRGEGDDGMRH